MKRDRPGETRAASTPLALANSDQTLEAHYCWKRCFTLGCQDLSGWRLRVVDYHRPFERNYAYQAYCLVKNLCLGRLAPHCCPIGRHCHRCRLLRTGWIRRWFHLHRRRLHLDRPRSKICYLLSHNHFDYFPSRCFLKKSHHPLNSHHWLDSSTD